MTRRLDDEKSVGSTDEAEGKGGSCGAGSTHERHRSSAASPTSTPTSADPMTTL